MALIPETTDPQDWQPSQQIVTYDDLIQAECDWLDRLAAEGDDK